MGKRTLLGFNKPLKTINPEIENLYVKSFEESQKDLLQYAQDYKKYGPLVGAVFQHVKEEGELALPHNILSLLDKYWEEYEALMCAVSSSAGFDKSIKDVESNYRIEMQECCIVLVDDQGFMLLDWESNQYLFFIDLDDEEIRHHILSLDKGFIRNLLETLQQRDINNFKNAQKLIKEFLKIYDVKKKENLLDNDVMSKLKDKLQLEDDNFISVLKEKIDKSEDGEKYYYVDLFTHKFACDDTISLSNKEIKIISSVLGCLYSIERPDFSHPSCLFQSRFYTTLNFKNKDNSYWFLQDNFLFFYLQEKLTIKEIVDLFVKLNNYEKLNKEPFVYEDFIALLRNYESYKDLPFSWAVEMSKVENTESFNLVI